MVPPPPPISHCIFIVFWESQELFRWFLVGTSIQEGKSVLEDRNIGQDSICHILGLVYLFVGNFVDTPIQ